MNRNQSSKNSSSGLLTGILYALGGVALGVGAKVLYDELSDNKKEPEKNSKQDSNNKGTSDQNEFTYPTTLACDNIEYESFICPITQEIMRDPVITPQGISFDREAITDWLSKNPTCPFTKKPLKKEDLITNYALKNSIHAYLKKSQIKD